MWAHYQIAYLVGTGLILAAVVVLFGLPPQQALSTWMVVALLGWLIEPCLNHTNDRYGEMLWRGDPERLEIALTFDDGPDPVYTEQILDILAREQVRAAFFVVGDQVRRYPWIVARIRDEGHLVGNHTDTHQNLLLCTPSSSRREIDLGRQAIEEVLGEDPHWFRPPWGMRTPITMRQARQSGHQVALWTFDPRDWQQPAPDLLTRRVLENLVPGMVLLLHDANGDRTSTVVALPEIIRESRKRGYRFVRLDEMAPSRR